jgi:hypothetical protein
MLPKESYPVIHIRLMVNFICSPLLLFIDP